MIPPRRSLKDLLVPRDATETARQGQGIGDLEAIMQMATTAIPEALRVAPATSTPMGLFDTANALADRDYAGAGMAALGAIPFAGALKYADEVADVAKSAMRGAKSLPMDTPSRMARAAEQGFSSPVYHATSRTTPIDELKPSNGLLMDLNAIHVGTKKSANDRAGAVHVLSTPSGLQMQSAKAANTRRGWSPDNAAASAQGGVLREDFAPSIMPLMMKAERPYLNPATGAPWTEREFQKHVGEWIRENAPKLGETDRLAAKQLMKQDLLEQGYDVIPYVNAIEGGQRYKSGHAGDVSYMVLKPENLRSSFAKFDPANVGKAGLMGALAGTLGMSAANNRNAKGSK